MDPLRAAAFGDRPGADVWRAATGTAEERWLAAVVLGGQGHYAAAATLLQALVRSGDPLTVSLAASTLASHRRQLGAHAVARRLDALALATLPPLPPPAHNRGDAHDRRSGDDQCTDRRPLQQGDHLEVDGLDKGRSAQHGPAKDALAKDGPAKDGLTEDGLSQGSLDEDGVDLAGARADALLGLAADALGVGRLVEARRLHAQVVPRGWRTTVRRHWVAAEIELASGYAELAVGPAVEAVEQSEAAGATRHILKSRLVLGTALVVWGTPESAERGGRILQCVLNHTHCHGLLSLSWPTALVLLTSPVVRNPAETAKVRTAAVNALSCVLRRADPISRRVAAHSPWIPTALLRSGEPPNADPQTNFLTD